MGTFRKEPVWKQRAVERSIRTAKLRAEQRVQECLEAARALIVEKGNTDFTVQEVVDRSGQSLRTFYLQFSGKHELLLALYEDALAQLADQIHDAAGAHTDPVQRLRAACHELFELSRPDAAPIRPLLTEFATQLLVTHPTEVQLAHTPLVALFTELIEKVGAAHRLRTEVDAERTAILMTQMVLFLAQSIGSNDDFPGRPINAEEVWTFCAFGFADDRPGDGPV
ncbi:TetR/AcrR family transcriptional regulator [Nocardia sp. alder85J]|uniref:TetR/AcrR family transcriptional regulator n=1 Tax=Nocardia sp. alder85J TaxID=2862949 RepID=UPI00224D52B8|nr:TetR/AcrR family transcriptional regulator [Nocardia sp. alder85J]MCX4096909.1 TetR/AcrR family transcriptional regulator [Nocardia sp. alder85J]